MRPRRPHLPVGFARIFLVLGALALVLQPLGAAIHARTHSHAHDVTRHVFAAQATLAHECPAHHHADHYVDHYADRAHRHGDRLAGASSKTGSHHGLPSAIPPPDDDTDPDGHGDHGDCQICAKLISGSRALIVPNAAPALADALVSASADARYQPAPRSGSSRPRTSRGPPLAS
jgi:hypothetical protein